MPSTCSAPATTNGFDTTKIGDWYGVIAGRLGVAFDRVLLYAKGGVAFVDKSYGYTDACVAPVLAARLTLTSGPNSDTQIDLGCRRWRGMGLRSELEPEG